MSTENELNTNEWEVIHSYTRAQAYADGVLIDVTETAREAGLLRNTAITTAAWAESVAWNHGGGQDEKGRLWDVVYMAYVAIVQSRRNPRSELVYTLYRVPNERGAEEPERISLKLVIGPGDHMEPVLTIMCPNED